MRLVLDYPVKSVVGELMQISQEFGVNGAYYQANGINIVGHNGLDIVARNGEKIYASHDGIVHKTEIDSKGGIGIEIRTDKKYEYKGRLVYFKTQYWHLEKWLVEIGKVVKRSEVIALADNTGFSTGPHLHYSLKPMNDDFTNIEQNNGYFGAIDPMPYFPSRIMKFIIVNGKDQYLLYEPYKIAISIADIEELQSLRQHGLSSFPDPVSQDALNGYEVYPGIRTKRLKDILNL